MNKQKIMQNPEWRYFSENLNKFGKTRLIPILGSGFNIRANPKSYDWGGFLNEIANKIGIKNRLNYDLSVSSMTSIWEKFVIAVREKSKLPILKAENLLKREVVKCLNDFEVINKTNSFYNDFLQLGFQDIFSINFDRSLALSQDVPKKNIERITKRAFDAQHSLFRHTSITKNNLSSRIWYPHGDTENYLTIKLGVRSYGLYIRSLSTSFKFYRKKQKVLRLSSASYLNSCGKIRKLLKGELNWFWLGLSAPIIFLGCSLSKDEWPLWWFLHQRARHLAHYPDGNINSAYILLNTKSKNPKTKDLIRWLFESPANLKILPCDSWEEGWEYFFDILLK